MLGMDAHVGLERLKGLDCNGVNSLKPCGCENGELKSHLEDCGVDGGVGGLKGAALSPITPVPCRKIGEVVSVVSSPLSTESPQSPSVGGLDGTSSGEVVVSSLKDSPRTPKEGVFNPFAPGPEEMCLAPLCKKAAKESRRIVARRLNFEDVDERMGDGDKDEDAETEKALMETVYGTLLEAIILQQTEDFLAQNHPSDIDGCCTPTSPPPLNGIAETCPAAPSKATARKSVNIDQGLCRKLEF